MKRKKIHFLIGFGIFLSVATLVLTLSVMNGFDRLYEAGILKFHPHITLSPQDSNSLSIEAVQKVINRDPKLEAQVKSVKPFLYREALFARKGVIKGVLLKGILLDESLTTNGILLGESLAEKLGISKREGISKPILQGLSFSPLSKESSVKLFIPKDSNVSSKDLVSLPVVGVFKSGLYELDSEFALLSLKELQKLFKIDEGNYGLEIELKNPLQAEEIAALLSQEFPEKEIRSWQEDHQALFDALQLEKWMFRILIGFMIAISILNLVGTILLTLFQKKHVIAILRALGLSQTRVVWRFASEGIFLGGIGLFLGLAVGSIGIGLLNTFQWIAIDPQVYFLDKLPFHFSLWDVAAIFLLSLLWIVFVSWWCAHQATKISIREGLHEP